MPTRPQKPITPPAGAKTRSEARPAPTVTRSRLGGATPRSKGQRGSENVRETDSERPKRQGQVVEGEVLQRGQANVEDEYFSQATSSDPSGSALRVPAGRGNEGVRADDVNSRAHQATKTQWGRVPGALEYLRSYVAHLEAKARNKDALSSVEAIHLQNQVHQFKEKVSEMIKSPAEKIFDILRFTVIPELMLDEGITSLTVEGVGRCNIMDDISVSVPAENKAQFNEWLVESGFEDLITQTVNAQTLAKFVREQLKKKDGVKLPTELIKITPVTRAQITRV